MSNEQRITRRGFLKTTGVVAGAAIAVGAVAVSGVEAANAKTNTMKGHTMPPAESKTSSQLRAKIFFTDNEDFQTLSHATERIFPKDKTGPGAIELSVPYFIDNQLAGAYGLNAREYIAGPFFPGTPQQTYQTPMVRADVFRQGILALRNESKAKFTKGFTALSDSQKDEILKSFEKGEAKMEGAPSSYFFSLLKSMTIAGVYADPIYNGNNNMDGWLMKNYPGAQMSYLDMIMDKKFKKIEPLSLADMQ